MDWSKILAANSYSRGGSQRSGLDKRCEYPGGGGHRTEEQWRQRPAWGRQEEGCAENGKDGRPLREPEPEPEHRRGRSRSRDRAFGRLRHPPPHPNHRRPQLPLADTGGWGRAGGQDGLGRRCGQGEQSRQGGQSGQGPQGGRGGQIEQGGWGAQSDEGLLYPPQITALLTRQCRSPREILDVCRWHGSQFNEINCSIAVHRIAKCHAARPHDNHWLSASNDLRDLLGLITRRLEKAPRAFQPQNLANIR